MMVRERGGALWDPRTPRVGETSEVVWPNFPPNNSKKFAWREWQGLNIKVGHWGGRKEQEAEVEGH